MLDAGETDVLDAVAIPVLGGGSIRIQRGILHRRGRRPATHGWGFYGFKVTKDEHIFNSSLPLQRMGDRDVVANFVIMKNYYEVDDMVSMQCCGYADSHDRSDNQDFHATLGMFI